MEQAPIKPLYKRILGERYETLPGAVRTLHDLQSSSSWRGVCQIRRGKTRLSHICAFLLSMPPAGHNIPVTVNFESIDAAEHWIRRFANHETRSIQFARKGKLIEKIGITTIVFDILANSEKLSLELNTIKAFGLPFSFFLKPAIIANETEQDGKFCFHVKASLPIIGLVIEYQGWLEQVHE